MTKPLASLHTESTQQSPRLVLGVDGGGTKTVAWLARFVPDGDPEMLGRGVAGSSNIRSAGWDDASSNLQAAIDAAWKDWGSRSCVVDSAVFALAGSGLPEVRDRFSAWAEARSISKRLRIIHDAQAALIAGTPAECGVALIAGTGSVAYGQDVEGANAVSGGWGYWFGDEGSAYWLGQQALRAVAQASDSRGPDTKIVPKVLERLGIVDPREMISSLEKTGNTRLAIAELADVVTSVAQRQDQVACRIVDRAGQHLASMVDSVAQDLSLGNEFPLALAGGVLCKSHLVREKLLECLSDNLIQPTDVQLVAEPVAGCLKMANSELLLNR